MDFDKTNFRLEIEVSFVRLSHYLEKMGEQLNALSVKEREQARIFSGRGYALYQLATSGIYDHEFPNTLHYSYIVLLFITIEDCLNKTCDLLHQANKLPLRAKDLRGDAIGQCMRFLDKLAGIPRDDLLYWPQISDLSQIRNCIVHTSGHIELSRDKKHLLELVQKQPDALKLSEHENHEDRVLVVEHSYCMHSTENARNFFKEILEKAGMAS